jgi:hypothetical protein
MSMRRIRWPAVVLTASALALTGPAPVRADFHPSCVGIVTASAAVDLQASSDGKSTWSGTVNCPAAASVTVDVTLSRVAPDGFNPVAASGSCGDPVGCLDAVTASETGALADGTYQVRMLFSTAGPVIPVFTFTDVERCGRWEVAGTSVTGPTAC